MVFEQFTGDLLSCYVKIETKRSDILKMLNFYSAAEEMSEVTSSANSSPSLSSRGSMKASGRYSRGVSPALSLSGGRGKKSIIDMSNPAFLKPFELGE